MKISSLKALLKEFDDNDEIAVSIAIGDNKIPVITYDISFGVNEHEGFVLEVHISSSDFDE